MIFWDHPDYAQQFPIFRKLSERLLVTLRTSAPSETAFSEIGWRVSRSGYHSNMDSMTNLTEARAHLRQLQNDFGIEYIFH